MAHAGAAPVGRVSWVIPPSVTRVYQTNISANQLVHLGFPPADLGRTVAEVGIPVQNKPLDLTGLRRHSEHLDDRLGGRPVVPDSDDFDRRQDRPSLQRFQVAQLKLKALVDLDPVDVGESRMIQQIG